MADVLVSIDDSAVSQYELLSGKNNANYVNCALLIVKLQTVGGIEICATNYCSSTRRYGHFKERIYAR
jgi:hypothetical protein